MSARVRLALDESGAVAIKVAHSPEDVAALRYEIGLLKQASHPGLVTVLDDLDRDPHHPELRTRYAGEPLDRWRGDLPGAVALGAAIAATLADLHGMGLVHGRVDGSHVLVGADGRPRLCGFAPAADSSPPHDVAALAELLGELIDRARSTEPRWPLPRRGAGSTDRRAVADVLRRASDPDPARRPSARSVATALLAAVPGAQLREPAVPLPAATRRPTTQAATQPTGDGSRVGPSRLTPASRSGVDAQVPSLVRAEAPSRGAQIAGSEPDADLVISPATEAAQPRSARPSRRAQRSSSAEPASPPDSPASRGRRSSSGAGERTELVAEVKQPPGRNRRRPEARTSVDDAASGQGEVFPPAAAPEPEAGLLTEDDPVFGNQTTAELEEIFVDRPWPSPPPSVARPSVSRPTAASPPRRQRRAQARAADRGPGTRRRATTTALLGLTLVAGGAAALHVTRPLPPAGGSLASGEQESAPVTCDNPPADPPSDASAVASADVDGDGCVDQVRVGNGVVEVGGQRWQVGDSDDAVAVADWDCDGTATPAIYRPATGDVFVFTTWASTGKPVAVAAADNIVGGRRLASTATDAEPCPQLAVEMPTGEHLAVEVDR